VQVGWQFLGSAHGCSLLSSSSFVCTVSVLCLSGPVAAAYKAIDALVNLPHVPELREYTVNSLTEGIEALVTTRYGALH